VKAIGRGKDGVFIHQEIKEDSAPGFGTGNNYNYGIEKELMDKLRAIKDVENQSLKEEIRYLKEKIDQLMEVVGKKG